MGDTWSRGWSSKLHPEQWPDYQHPPTFDPLVGFPEGRKPREMKATWDEMNEVGMANWERDYCAHLKVSFYRCRRSHQPFVSYYCKDIWHAWEQCEFEDYILRMKEFERERRLILRRNKDVAASKESH